MKRYVNISKFFRLVQILSLKKKYYYKTNILQKKFLKYTSECETSTLDLGSGPKPKNPFSSKNIYGVDIRERIDNNVLYARLGFDSIPYDDNSFDYVTSYDLLEHIPRFDANESTTDCFPFIYLMNEIFRVLKYNGIFFNLTPCYPVADSFQDPTHVNIMTEDTILLYFCEPLWSRIYGFTGSFTMLEEGWYRTKYFSFIRKSTREPDINLNYAQKHFK